MLPGDSHGDNKRKISYKKLSYTAQLGPAGGGKLIKVPQKYSPTGEQPGEEVGPEICPLAAPGVSAASTEP